MKKYDYGAGDEDDERDRFRWQSSGLCNPNRDNSSRQPHIFETARRAFRKISDTKTLNVSIIITGKFRLKFRIN